MAEQLEKTKTAKSAEGPRPSASDDIYLSVQRFLSHEAELLDRRAYQDWFKLWTADLAYRVTAQVNQEAAAPVREYAIMEDDATGLKARLDQISTPRLTHAENPPSLARRFFSGLQVYQGDGPDEYIASANVLVYRTRPELPAGGFYVGTRRDVVRRVDGEWRLARRSVRLDQATIYGGVSTIF
jgi:3-phenylpropionate/cinnamic acid dioxygenase small subunit